MLAALRAIRSLAGSRDTSCFLLSDPKCGQERSGLCHTAIAGDEEHSKNPWLQDLITWSDSERGEETWPGSSVHLPFASLLRRYGKTKALGEGKLAHARIITCGLEQTIFLGNLLMHMYAKCGALEEAHSVFCCMGQHNLFSWAIMMGAFVDHGQSKETLKLFQKMLLQGLMPDKVTFITLVSACSNEGAVTIGQLLHVQIIDCGLHTNVVVGTALISMYSKCGCLENAQKAFENMLEQNVISWNALIAVYVDHGQPEEAWHLFKQMQAEGMIPDRATFVTVLPVCTRLIDGQQIHASMVGTDLESQVCFGTSLVHMYGKYGGLGDSLKAFNKLPERNVVSWNAYISACSQNNKYMYAISLLRQMQHEGIMADKVTFVSMLGACGNQVALEETKQLHVSIIVLGYITHIAVGTALVKAYSDCNSVEDAWWVFNQMPQHTIISWNTMIGACVQRLQWHRSLQLFKQMQLEGNIADKVTFTTILSGCACQAALTEGVRVHVIIAANLFKLDAGSSLLNMYAKCGDLEAAWTLFETMPEHNVASWNSMISACAELGQCNQFLQLFQQMQCDGVMLDQVTCVTLLCACADMTVLDEGRRVHARILGSWFEADIVVGNAIINMYGKCGCLIGAKLMFEKMPKRNVITWNAMIGAFCQHGKVKDALKIFHEMQLEGEVPDRVTFFNVLSACSHGGLLDEGYWHFSSMCQVHNLTPTVEHFNCMIGLLGRAGRLDEGEDVINVMPFTATATSWMALLACCNIHLDGGRGKRAAEFACRLDPGNAATYVSLANIYSVVDRLVEHPLIEAPDSFAS